MLSYSGRTAPGMLLSTNPNDASFKTVLLIPHFFLISAKTINQEAEKRLKRRTNLVFKDLETCQSSAIVRSLHSRVFPIKMLL